MFFKNYTLLIPPVSHKQIIFACDPNYWYLYGRYLIKSCDELEQSVHVHILSDDLTCLKDLKFFLQTLKSCHSASYESIDLTIPEIPRFSYYFISRYYIANFLFESFDLDEAIITDADLIVNQVPTFPKNKDIGIFYRPEQERIFRKVWGNLFMIKKTKSWFLKSIINRYEKNYSEIDWNMVAGLKGKRIQNYSGQDQISIAEEINLVLDDHGFFNLKDQRFFKDQLWSLTGLRDNPEILKILQNRFKI